MLGVRISPGAPNINTHISQLGSTMIIPSTSDKFDPQWLEYISHDPVHPTVAKETRAQGSRTVLMYDEDEQHQCMDRLID